MNEEVKKFYEDFVGLAELLPIDEIDKCSLIMTMANVVSAVGRTKEPHLEACKLHSKTKDYAIRYAQLSDNLMSKLLSAIFLEDK